MSGQLLDDTASWFDLLRGQHRIRRRTEGDGRELLSRFEDVTVSVIRCSAGHGHPEQGDHRLSDEDAAEVCDVERLAGLDERDTRLLGEEFPAAGSEVVVPGSVEEFVDPVTQDLRPEMTDPALAEQW